MATIWNNLSLPSRKRLLSQSGYSKMYANKDYDHLPSWVRIDIEYTYKLIRVDQV